MFGIGETELVIILVFGFLLFGPDKLPGLGRTLGRAIRQFREAEEGFTKVVQTEFVEPIQAAATATVDKGTKRSASKKDLDSDADVDNEHTLDDGSVPKESFAERKARLEAERKQAHRASVASQGKREAGADSNEELPPVPPDASSPSAQKRTSAALLYNLDTNEDDLDIGEGDLSTNVDAGSSTGKGEGSQA